MGGRPESTEYGMEKWLVIANIAVSDYCAFRLMNVLFFSSGM